MMQTNVYALLVGINEYPPYVNPLQGCVNDVNRMQTFLRERLRRTGEDLTQFHPLVLTDQQATRQAIIDAFYQHLGKAKGDDVALFYFSGHGSQAPSPPEFWHLEPDRLDETLVCWDSRLPGPKHWDLADKELAQLVADVADTGAHVVVILDCCHSGSGTRSPAESDMRVRRVPTDNRIRPLDTFLVSPQQATAFTTAGRSVGGSGGWYRLPRGRHIVLSACSPEEEAKELSLGGERRGIFSYYFLDTLEKATGSLSYRDIFKRVNALVRAGVSLQSPQIEATEASDLEQPFLGGAIPRTQPYFTASHDRQFGWVIDGGAVHGLPSPTADETTFLALFPFDADVSTLDSLTHSIGEASITDVFPGQSTVAMTWHDQQINPQTTYKAVVTTLPLPPCVVALEGDDSGLALIRSWLARAGLDGGPSLLVREGAQGEAELSLRAEENGYHIRRKGDGYNLVVETPGYTSGSAQLAIQRLEHIARWRRIVELSNPGSRLPVNGVKLEIELPAGNGAWKPAPPGELIRLEYTLRDGRWQQPYFRVRLANRSKLRLYCMVFDLTEVYGVYPILPGGGLWLEPGQETWANAGDPIYASIPQPLWQAGLTQLNDTLLLVVSTDESDAMQLAQDDLPAIVSRSRSAKSVSRMNTLNRLMHRVGTRNFSIRPDDDELFADWITSQISFVTIRPPEAVDIAAPGEKAVVYPGVTVLGHPTLKARARLVSQPDVGRDVGNLTLPALLRDRPDIVQPFELSTSRGGGPGLSVIELIDVTDHTAVTSEQPLVIQMDAALGPDEYLLPMTHDDEFFLPLGHVERTLSGVTVTLDRLPPPSGTRSLGGSIKILFQKLVGQPLGLSYDYPQLSMASVDIHGRVRYEKDQDAVRRAVARQNPSQPILLYIHGIIGDTRSMASSAHTDWLQIAPPVPGLAIRYPLILTFDYENLHTSIEENARLLRARLEAVGLGPNHGKTLHIVAHSMGGLVSRWFIEQEGGSQMVQHLVMLGTPNAGSPWPTIQDWATIALGIGLNSLSGVAWPLQALGVLVAALEKVDVALDEVKPGSELLTKLAASADPGIPYTTIIGNTSIIPAALALEPDKSTRLIERLWARIAPRRLLHAMTAPLFFGQPNDIAVTVESSKGLPDDFRKLLSPLEVACDHISYFSTAAGLSQLNDAL